MADDLRTTIEPLAAAIEQEIGNARHHLLMALACAGLLSGKLQVADDLAEHIKAALKLLPQDITHGGI